MTASIGQSMAVFPRALGDDTKKNDQGPLWKVLHRINSLPGELEAMEELKEALRGEGWFVSNDGKCRYIETGKLVSGRKIREEFSGDVNGLMPIKGPGKRRTETWVRLFHNLFACPCTFELQLALEKEHFVKRATRIKLRFCKNELLQKETMQKAIYDPVHISAITVDQMGLEMDLAMSMYWSHSVNAPSFALKKFCRQVLDKPQYGRSETTNGEAALAKHIIKKLGNTTFGRWDDDIKHGRYQRTRAHAMKLWPRELFVGSSAIMPINLIG